MRTVRRPQRLRECLQSLAAQTLREFELILVDMSDGSVSSIVEKMTGQLPAFRHLKLDGVRSRPAALNRGIELAEGDLITILDDDNLWDSDHLQNIVRDFNGADLVYTGVRVQTFTIAGDLMHERIHHLPFDFPDYSKEILFLLSRLLSVARSGTKSVVTMSVFRSTRTGNF